MDDSATKSGEWIDPEEFPFTEEEVFQAAVLWKESAEARRFAQHVADTERTRAAREARSAAERVRHSERTGEVITFVSGSIGTPHADWLLPTLSVLSASCSKRVEDVMAVHWRQRMDSVLSAYQAEAWKRAGFIPTPEELIAVGSDETKIRAMLEEVRRNILPRSQPTEETVRAASEEVEREKRAWLALAAECNSRLAHHRAALELPPRPPQL